MQTTRSITSFKPLTDKNTILPLAKKLIEQVDYSTKPIRLIGLSVSNPHNEKHVKNGLKENLSSKNGMILLHNSLHL